MPIVSDMYKITASALPAPLTIRMKHCAVVEDSDSLVFIVAHGSPPYRFELLYGGKFPVGESYGEIKLQRFSILAILAHTLGWRMSLSVQVFYRRNNNVAFVVTKNTNLPIQAVQSEYADSIDVSRKSIQCDYTMKAITLILPVKSRAGWVIAPKFQPPQILTNLIQKYRPGITPPAIELQLKWTGGGEPREEDVEIDVEGCFSIKSFTLSCKPRAAFELQPFQPPEQPVLPPSLQSTSASSTPQSHTPPPSMELEGICCSFPRACKREGIKKKQFFIHFFCH